MTTLNVFGPVFVGFFVGDEIICFKHWDKRRNAEYYQPAMGEDMKLNPCSRCVVSEYINRTLSGDLVKVGDK